MELLHVSLAFSLFPKVALLHGLSGEQNSNLSEEFQERLVRLRIRMNETFQEAVLGGHKPLM